MHLALVDRVTNVQAAVVASAQAAMVTPYGPLRATGGFGAGRLTVVGSKLGQLEADKADAIRREDYDAAKALKSRIDRMRAGGGAEDGAPQPRRAAPQRQAGGSDSTDGGGGGAAEPAPQRRSQPRESRPSAHDERVPPPCDASPQCAFCSSWCIIPPVVTNTRPWSLG